MPVVVRTSISNHHPSGKRKKPKPRHNAPCLRQLVRYKLYEIRLDTLKKRRYAPAEPSRAEPSRAEPSRAIFAPLSIIVKPSFRNFSKKRISIPFLTNTHKYYSSFSIKPQVAFKILSVTILNALPLPLLAYRDTGCLLETDPFLLDDCCMNFFLYILAFERFRHKQEL